MTTSAWILLGVTWGVICFFTGKFFLRVMRRPLAEDGSQDEAGPAGGP